MTLHGKNLGFSVLSFSLGSIGEHYTDKYHNLLLAARWLAHIVQFAVFPSPFPFPLPPLPLRLTNSKSLL
jgi:hypothetical protein